MASSIKCECGQLIGTNMFAGADVSLVVSDSFLDSLPEPRTERDLEAHMLRRAPHLFRCSFCGRIAIENPEDNSIAFYVPSQNT